MVGVIHEPLLELRASEESLSVVSGTDMPLDLGPVPSVELDTLTEPFLFSITPHPFIYRDSINDFCCLNLRFN